MLTRLRSSASKYYEMESLRGLGLALLGLGQRVEARAAFSEMLELALAATARTPFTSPRPSPASLSAPSQRTPTGGAPPRRRQPAQQRRRRGDGCVRRTDAELEGHFERELVAVLGKDAWELEKAAGSTMTLEQAIAVARLLCDGAEAAASVDS